MQTPVLVGAIGLEPLCQGIYQCRPSTGAEPSETDYNPRRVPRLVPQYCSAASAFGGATHRAADCATYGSASRPGQTPQCSASLRTCRTTHSGRSNLGCKLAHRFLDCQPRTVHQVAQAADARRVAVDDALTSVMHRARDGIGAHHILGSSRRRGEHLPACALDGRDEARACLCRLAKSLLKAEAAAISRAAWLGFMVGADGLFEGERLVCHPRTVHARVRTVEPYAECMSAARPS